jgi:trans-aconitate 2-methyltransferase
MGTTGAVWDAAQYERFAAERGRPFHELLARVPDGDVALAADLGCGTGRLTRILAERWPRAQVWGVDSSREMLARAGEGADSPRLHFVAHDLATWQPPGSLDRIVSNAALHWLPDHDALLARLAGMLAPRGVLAVQMPNNAAEQPHRTLADLVAEPAWRARIGTNVLAPGARPVDFYVRRLRALGLEVDAWETTYCHQLPGPAAVVEWLKGTTLRPILGRLDDAGRGAFLDTLNARLAPHYAGDRDFVMFPFRRLFFVAQRPA